MNYGQVILVDENDIEIGVAEKLEAHQRGLLHRAFSIVIFNKAGQMLIHKRAESKYHTPGLWTNACCSHQQPGLTTEEVLESKLMQEMGFACSLSPAFKFVYTAHFDNGLTEHELDHVFIGEYSDAPIPNPDEVGAWRYADPSDIRAEIQNYPSNFTPWFKELFEPSVSHYQSMFAVK